MKKKFSRSEQLSSYLYSIYKAYQYNYAELNYDNKDVRQSLSEALLDNDSKLVLKIVSDSIRYYLNINVPKRTKKLENITIDTKNDKIKKIVSTNYWINEVSTISEYLYFVCEGVVAIVYCITATGFTVVLAISRKGDFVESGIFFPSTLDENLSKSFDYSFKDMAQKETENGLMPIPVLHHEILFWFSESSLILPDFLFKSSDRDLIISEEEKRFIKHKFQNALNLYNPLIPKIEAIVLRDFQLE